jgi:phospholipase/carboxylesterase
VKRTIGLALLTIACQQAAASHPRPLEALERTLGSGDGPILVLLHGYASSPETFLGLVDRTDLPRGTLLVLPRAPLPVPGVDQGTMWWPLPRDFGRIRREHLPGLDEARERVVALVERLETEHPGRRVLLGGFSQGAITTLDVALRNPTLPLAGIALMSGTMSDEYGTMARLEARRGLRVYVSHGTHDRVLSYDDDARLVDAMRAHGLDVTFDGFDGGHVVTPEVSRALAAFFTRCASP